MRIDAFLIALILTTLFLVGGISISQEQQELYNYSSDEGKYEELTNITSSITANVTTLANSIISSEVSDEDTENNLFKSGYSFIIGSWSLFSLAGSLITAIGKVLGVPAYMLFYFFAILAVSAGAFVLYLVFRFKPQD